MTKISQSFCWVLFLIFILTYIFLWLKQFSKIFQNRCVCLEITDKNLSLSVIELFTFAVCVIGGQPATLCICFLEQSNSYPIIFLHNIALLIKQAPWHISCSLNDQIHIRLISLPGKQKLNWVWIRSSSIKKQEWG